MKALKPNIIIGVSTIAGEVFTAVQCRILLIAVVTTFPDSLVASHLPGCRFEFTTSTITTFCHRSAVIPLWSNPILNCTPAVLLCI